ncbi:hypothetical protein RISK_000106 [Rhodopirellula islandica]|uniref:Uncharacterized protein n=1 Tax=Rhodopirellula islandica TaxID=595434 RepID=A0A0J1BN86_RHOIS|nr:hypothetical protein RISK_000106 [Rhodopirellula islandica]
MAITTNSSTNVNPALDREAESDKFKPDGSEGATERMRLSRKQVFDEEQAWLARSHDR